MRRHPKIAHLGDTNAALDDGSTWPRAGRLAGDIEHAMRYGSDADMKNVRMLAASIIAAYRSMVLWDSADRRNDVVAALRLAEKEGSKT